MSPVLAGNVKTLAPVTPWNVDYAPATCTLARGFGDKAKPDIFMLEQFGPSTTFQLLLISDQLPRYEQGETLFLRYGESARIPLRSAMPGTTKAGKHTLTIARSALVPFDELPDDVEAPSVTEAQEAAVTSVSVQFHGRTTVFATGRMDKAFATLRKCTDQLVQSWGLDPVQQRTLSARPRPLSKPSNWITSSAYPSGMVMMGKQGLVNFRLSVDEKGVPTACEIQRSYSDPQFDKVTCQLLMRRGRFAPARDAAGKPIASYYLNSVRFIMP